MMLRFVNAGYMLIVLLAALILAFMLRQALSADSLVQRVQLMLGVSPGQMIPADPRFPDIRLQYMGTSRCGNDYCVRVRPR